MNLHNHFQQTLLTKKAAPILRAPVPDIDCAVAF